MKNIYSREMLISERGEYQRLKKNEVYKCHYKWLKRKKALMFKCLDDVNASTKIKRLVIDDCKKLLLQICEEWNLKSVISPNLKIRKEDLLKTSFRDNSPIVKLIKTYDVRKDPKLVVEEELKQKGKTVMSKKRTKREGRCKKLWAYTLNERGNHSLATIARILGKSRKTIGIWIDEVEEWSETERTAVLSEIINGTSKDISFMLQG